jgi:hypothetical protein
LSGLRSAYASLSASLRAEVGVEEAKRRTRHAEQALSNWTRRRAAAGRPPPEPPPVDAIIDAVGETTMLEMFECRGQVHALLVQRRRVRRIELGPSAAIREGCLAAMQTLRRLALVVGTSAAGLVAASTRSHVGRARALLAPSLGRAIADAHELVVVPPPTLHDAPWRLLLGADCPLAVAPSAGAWLRAAPAGTREAGRVVVVAGPALPGAESEAQRVAAIHGVEAIVGTNATTDRVASVLDGASLVHLSAHATIRPSSPLFSSLELTDGPLTAYELEGLRSAPRIVVLPACSAGHATARSAGELLGLSTVLLDGGAACLVAPTIPIPDETSVETVVRFHQHLREGATTSQAVAAAIHDLDADDPAGLVAMCTLTCFGRGDTELPPGLRAPGARTME